MTTCLEREIRQILPLPKETAEEAARRKARRKRPRKWQRRFPTPLPRADSTEFAYVLKDAEAQAVSFGSTAPRNTGIHGKGAPHSRIIFTARRETDTREYLGPATYDTPTRNAFYQELFKTTSIFGVGIGARRAKRFPEMCQECPGPGEYRQERPPPKQNLAPFNSSTHRKSLIKVSKNPGPGAYFGGGGCRPLWKYHFGSAPREPVPLVSIRCTNGRPLGRCELCDEELPSGREYWRNSSGKKMLCIRCMRIQKEATAKNRFNSSFTYWQLQAFQRERDCSDYHEHEGTTAKIHLFPESVVTKRLRLEAYLGRFFVDDGPPDDPDRDKRPAALVDRRNRSSKEPSDGSDGCAHLRNRPDCIDLCLDIPSISVTETISTNLGDGPCFENS